MSDLPATSPHDDADELLAELLADRLLEMALSAPGPARAVALRAAGLLPPGELSQEIVAAVLGLSRWEVRTTENRGLARARRKLSPPPSTETQP